VGTFEHSVAFLPVHGRQRARRARRTELRGAGKEVEARVRPRVREREEIVCLGALLVP